MIESKQFWIPGIPAPFATRGEILWRKILEQSISTPPAGKFLGLELKFILPTLSPRNQPLDIDNLCEPVFSVLINKLGWFGSKRPNLKWWCASKICGQSSGLQLSVLSTSPPEIVKELGRPFFDDIYEGTLPCKATDPQIPSWLCSLKNLNHYGNNDRFVVRLQFENPKVNIGDIATGKVKTIIDCFYPVIGGDKGKPEDWRIDVLQVEKCMTNLKSNCVRISIWKKR